MFHNRPHNKNPKSYAMIHRENKENQNVNAQQQPKLKSRRNSLCQQSSSTIEQSLYEREKDWEEQLKQTFTNILKQHYSEDILTYMVDNSWSPTSFLSQHEISPALRAKMVDWMIEVLSSYKMCQKSFFRSVNYMDTYFAKCQKKLMISDLHLVGVASMFMATKYEDIYPLKLNALYEKICRKKFTKNQILSMEQDIINCMDFQLQAPTLMDIVEHVLVQLPIQLSPKLQKYLQDVTMYLSKLIYHSYELCQNELKQLGGAIVYLGLKTLEQVENFKAENYYDLIVEKCMAEGTKMLKISQEVLEFAKSFRVKYPNLTNLKKFNPVQY